ncbi:MAG: hypothetical protein PHI32_15040 [Dysgonamonadaceae bacterium]|nr:hypothetical protein [Dysgonamonadaceae bacterium]
MVRNYFYLIVGFLCVLFAVTHTLNGMETTLPILNNMEIESSNTKVAFIYIWHIIGVENLIFGIFLIFMAFCKNMSKVKFAAWLIIVILALRWSVITYFTMSNNNGNIKQLIPDTVAIFIVIILLFLGTKVKDKKIDE